MAFPVQRTGKLIIGQPMREMRVNLGPAFANAQYQYFLTGTATPANVYQDGALTNPFTANGTGVVVANSTGLFPAIYLDSSVTYKVQLVVSGNTVRTYDPYVAPLAATGSPSTTANGMKLNAQNEVALAAAAGGTGFTLTINTTAPAGGGVVLNGTNPGSVCLQVDSSVTTGAQTATFTATNKPGIVTSAPVAWLPIKCDSVVYYTPLWRGDSYVPLLSSPQVFGQAIRIANSANGQWSWNGDGTTTKTGGAFSAIIPSSWYLPATAGIGASFWVNITKSTGLSGVNFSAAQGSWVNIGAGGLTVNLSGASNTALTGTYQISANAGGTAIVASGTISVTSSDNNGPDQQSWGFDQLHSDAAPLVLAGNGTTTLNGVAGQNWYLPTTGNVGASYWINITRVTGSTGWNFAAAQGAWTNITNGGLTIDISGGAGSGTFYVGGNYQLSSNVGGTAIVATGTIYLQKTITNILRVYTTAGAGTETMPAATNVTIESWGAGGGGSAGHGSGCSGQIGNTGGTGAYCRTITTVAGLGGAGKTINFNIGGGGAGGVGGSGSVGGNTTVTNGTSSGLAAMTAGGGAGGTFAGGGGGGTASGGNSANTTGNTQSKTGITGSVGGDGSPYGGGGGGGLPPAGAGSAGSKGAVVFYYT